MKIKIIDMLVKMANNKNYKPTFKFEKNTYKYDEDTKCYKPSFIGLWKIYMILNDEVEIIEEPKKIEKIARCDDVKMTHYGELYKPTENEEILRIKFNKLIDEINNSKEK